MLALAFQAAAPVGANIAMQGGSRLAAGACLTKASLAAGIESPAPRRGESGQDGSGRDEAKSDLCAFCCSGVAPLEAGADCVGSSPLRWTAVAWIALNDVLPARGRDHARQARAPPVFA